MIVGKLSRRALLASAGAALAGCAVELPGQGAPVRLYKLTATKGFPKGLASLPWQISVEKPVASSGLDTARIALRQRDFAIEYYGRANWIDSATDMVQSLLIESLENSGRLPAVGRDVVGLRPDFVLRSELRDFQAELTSDTAGNVHVRLQAKLVRMPERTIFASASHEHVVAFSGAEMERIVVAFDEALRAVLAETVGWAVGALPPGRG